MNGAEYEKHALPELALIIWFLRMGIKVFHCFVDGFHCEASCFGL